MNSTIEQLQALRRMGLLAAWREQQTTTTDHDTTWKVIGSQPL
jgi:hypothetical protein